MTFRGKRVTKIASYPGLPSQLFATAAKKSCEGRPGYEAITKTLLVITKWVNFGQFSCSFFPEASALEVLVLVS